MGQLEAGGASVWAAFVDFSFCLVFVLFCCAGQKATKTWTEGLPEVSRPKDAGRSDTPEEAIRVSLTVEGQVSVDDELLGSAKNPQTQEKLTHLLSQKKGRVILCCEERVPIQLYMSLASALKKDGMPPLLTARETPSRNRDT